MPPSSIAVPEHVAKLQQAESQQLQRDAMIAANVQRMRFAVSQDIYVRIVSNEYTMATASAAHTAARKADPFGVRDDDEVREEVESQLSPISLGLNSAAQAAIQAADCFLFYHGVTDRQGRPVVPPPPAKDVTNVTNVTNGKEIVLE